MSKIKVNEVENRTGSTLTLGKSGTTIQLACGATQTGFGRAGSVNWCTTAKTSPFTSESGKGYFVDTSSGAVTVTLPASPSAGDIVSINDLKGTFDTNNVTLGRNSSKIKGACNDGTLNKERESVTVIYSGSCQGWVTTADANVTSESAVVFQYNVRYLVVAGGGGGGATCGGNGGGAGGGAGGYRTISCKSFSVTGGSAIPITVGGGGTAGTVPATYPTPSPSFTQATQGSNSIFSTITSTGGGFGSWADGGGDGGDGGSGGGASGGAPSTGGSGNTPPVSPPQGNNGGSGGGGSRGSGGGGAAAVGLNGSDSNGYTGGAGSNTTILGSIPQAPTYGEPGPAPGRYFAGGGGGGVYSGSPEAPSAANNGGLGGGGNGGVPGDGTAGSTNTGGGGGGGGRTPPAVPACGAAGGSGIVVIRHATANGGSGGNVVATCGSDTIRIFTGDGTFTP